MAPRNTLPRRAIRPMALLALVAIACLLRWRATSSRRSLATASLETIGRQARRDPSSRAAYYLGRRWLQLGNVAAAHDAFQSAAQGDPDDDAAWVGAAVTTAGPDAASQSVTILRGFLKRHPGSAQAHLALGQVYQRTHARAAAYAEALTATRLSPRDPEAWKLLGGEAFAIGHQSEGEGALRRAIALRPDDWRAQIALGDLLLRTQRVPEGLGCVRAACRTTPSEPLVWQLLLRVADTPEERSRAQSGLDQATEARNGVPAAPDSLTLALPGAADLTTLLRDADRLLQLKRLPEAQKAYLAILAANPNSALAFQGVGLTLNALNDREEAFFYLERATDLNADLAPAQYLLGDWFFQASFKKEAARRLQIAISVAPGNAACWHALGQADGALDVRNDQAEAAYRRAASIDPSNVAYLLDLADMLVIDNKTDEAETVYRRALLLAPRDPDALARLGGFLIDYRSDAIHIQEADRLLRQAVQIDPDSDFALYQLGRLDFDRGDDRGAIIALKQAVTLVPQIQEGWYALSRALARAGDRVHAAAAMQTCQSLRTQYQERSHTAEILKLQPGNYALHLKLARLYAQSGENAKALYEYTSYLRLKPQDMAAHREMDGLQARLEASGHMPSMKLFSAMVESSLQHDASIRS